MNDLLTTILLGLIEGVTEFLPVSSTGHMVLFSALTGVDPDDHFWQTFIVVIQIGAIAAVAVYFRERLWRLINNRRPAGGDTPLEMLSRRVPPSTPSGESAVAGGAAPVAGSLTAAPTATPSAPPVLDYADEERIRGMHPLVNIALATLPALVIGFLVHDYIEENLGSPWVVAWALALGGVAMLAAEWFRPRVTTQTVEGISAGQAIGIGFAQVLAAIFPGTSRSAATILGGLCLGLSRPAAAEFSFFIAIPVMICACGYKLLKWVMTDGASITGRQIALMAVGTLISFFVAWVVIAAFMSYIRRYTFVPFAVYRLLLAGAVFLTIWYGGPIDPATTPDNLTGPAPEVLPVAGPSATMADRG